MGRIDLIILYVGLNPVIPERDDFVPLKFDKTPYETQPPCHTWVWFKNKLSKKLHMLSLVVPSSWHMPSLELKIVETKRKDE